MTRDEFIRAVQSRFDKYDDAFKTRIEEALPIGVVRVCGEFQWLFLDKYTTMSTATSTTDASGKTVLDLPEDFAKMVTLFDDNQEITHVDRVTWLQMQIDNSGTADNPHYTIIGSQLVCSATWSSTLYAVYTRRGENFPIEELPDHLQYAALMAVVELLAPAYVNAGDKLIANPDVRQATKAYKRAIDDAMMIESRQKGRARTVGPAEHLRMRNDYP